MILKERIFVASVYPTALDNFLTNRIDGTIMAVTHATDHNNENDAINKIETELGVNPKGSYSSVAERLSVVAQNTQTASYTPVLNDANKIVEMNVATPNNLTIPPNASVPFPIGTIIEGFQLGVGQVTFVPGAGVTIRSPGNKLKLNSRYSSASLRKRATDEWVLIGDLVAAGGLALGGLLPARIGVSTGSVTNVATLAALTSALSSVPNGSVINITANIVGVGTPNYYVISRNAASGAPITITCDPGVTITGFTQWNIRGSYLRFLGLDIGYTVGDPSVAAALDPCCFKIDTNANHIEIDGCRIHNAGRMGINIQASPTDIQIWNNTIYSNGSTGNGILDHGVYWAYARGNSVLANNLIYDNCAFNVQLYPDAPGVIVTCNTIDGGVVHSTFSESRGGMIYADTDGATLANTITVGCLSTNAPNFFGFGTVSDFYAGLNNQFYDCIGYNDAAGSFDPVASKLIFNAACVTADPLYINRAAKNFHLAAGSPAIGKIQIAQYGYVPPLDKDGNPRITADAGCYRV